MNILILPLTQGSAITKTKRVDTFVRKIGVKGSADWTSWKHGWIGQGRLFNPEELQISALDIAWASEDWQNKSGLFNKEQRERVESSKFIEREKYWIYLKWLVAQNNLWVPASAMSWSVSKKPYGWERDKILSNSLIFLF